MKKNIFRRFSALFTVMALFFTTLSVIPAAAFTEATLTYVNMDGISLKNMPFGTSKYEIQDSIDFQVSDRDAIAATVSVQVNTGTKSSPVWEDYSGRLFTGIYRLKFHIWSTDHGESYRYRFSKGVQTYYNKELLTVAEDGINTYGYDVYTSAFEVGRGYTVTYYTDSTGDTVHYTQYVDAGTSVSKEAPDLSKDGYRFDGWIYYSGPRPYTFTFGDPIDKNYELYPKFTKGGDVYSTTTIVGGTGCMTQNGTYAASVDGYDMTKGIYLKPELPTGKRFSRWSFYTEYKYITSYTNSGSPVYTVIGTLENSGSDPNYYKVNTSSYAYIELMKKIKAVQIDNLTDVYCTNRLVLGTAPIDYTVTAAGCTVSADGSTYSDSLEAVHYGDKVYVRADQAPVGKIFSGFTASGVTFADSKAAETTFSMPAADAEISAVFTDYVPADLKALEIDVTSGTGKIDVNDNAAAAAFRLALVNTSFNIQTYTADINKDGITDADISFSKGTVTMRDDNSIDGAYTVSFTDDQLAELKKVGVDNYCGYYSSVRFIFPEKHKHSVKTTHKAVAATCEKDGSTAYYECECGLIFSDKACTKETTLAATVIKATGHDFKSVKKNVNKPTCTKEGGYDMYSVCKICGKEVLDYHYTEPANGHINSGMVEVARKEPTCTKAGYADHEDKCSVCGEVLSKSRIDFTATGHTFGEAVHENIKEATCTKAGSYDIVMYCTVCGEKLSSETVKTQALDHDWSKSEYVTVKAPTCTEAGVEDNISYCPRCGKEHSFGQAELPATGHNWDEGKVTKEPTETEEGIMTYTCLNDPEHTYTEAIPCLDKKDDSKSDDKKDDSSTDSKSDDKKDDGSTDSKSDDKKDDDSTDSKPDDKNDDGSTDSKPSATLLGDVNLDGQINITDVVMAAAHVKGIRALTGDNLLNADIDGNGLINITDIVRIAAHVKGNKPIA